MPERSGFVALLETEDEAAVRSNLIGRLRQSLSTYIGEPIDVFLLGAHSSQSEPRAEAATLSARSLSDSEMLFFDFADPTSTGIVVLSISRSTRSSVYCLSFPDLTMVTQVDKAVEVLSAFYDGISAMNARCIVAAGAELTIDDWCQTVDDVIRSTDMLGSLVDFVCCDMKDASKLSGFILMNERRRGLILRRNRVATP